MKPLKFNNFQSVHLKIARARALADELKIHVRDFLESNPYRLVKNVDEVNGIKQLIVKTVIPVPDIIPLMLGDVVHNYRTALDHLAHDLVLANNRGISQLHFPTGTDEAAFIGALDGRIKGAGQPVIDELRRREIYLGGRGAKIRTIHELDVADKHKMLIPQVGMVTLTNVRMGRHINIGTIRAEISDQGTVIIDSRLDGMTVFGGNIHVGNIQMPNKEIQFDEAIDFQIEISDAESVSRMDLISAIDSFDSEVVSLVDAFANDPRFRRRVSL